MHEIRKLKEDMTERASLHSYSMYIGDVSESSVQVILGFPSSCVGWILGALTPDFLASHRMSHVFLGQDRLSILDKPQWKLVCIATIGLNLASIYSSPIEHPVPFSLMQRKLKRLKL